MLMALARPETVAGSEAGAETTVFRNEIFSVISTPVLVDELLVGALTVGERLGDNAARELKLLTRTEILLLSGDAVSRIDLAGPRPARDPFECPPRGSPADQ